MGSVAIGIGLTVLIIAALYFGFLYAVAYAFVHPFRTPIFLSPGLFGDASNGF